ncbi:hypothetical protein DPMN_088387 [Dreissena polymorpha]|uniref:Uncharacterized protein n=1 Tax=Dreissena polymorpha TaxID=45954 RepID=A0A9D4KUX8_DREPO|nr:hypothetical protein DPMN_088387 [Dreissena polymorpha]
MDVNRSYHHRPKKLSGPAQSRPDVTDFVTEPDGRRTVGIQTSDHLRLQSHRSVSTSHADQSDQEGSFVSSEHGYTMVTSPMSVWTSNEQSQFGYQSDQASSSSGGVGSRCPEMTNHSLAPAARLSMRSMNSISSLASNLQRGPTEMWSTSETDLRPLPHFQDDLAYSVETEGIYPLSDHSPDHSPKHSVYMRAPKEGVFLVPRPDCSTPNHTGHVTISFPESQLQQVNGLESNTPVTFEVTVHESNTDIVYNVDRTEYKTCTINNPNETQQRKIPESILVNVTEKRVCKTDDRKSTTHSEEVVFKCHPESNAMTDTSLVIENSMQLQTTAERETVFKNGEVVSEQTQQRTFKVTDKTNTFVPINNDYEENDERPKNKLQNSGVLGATSYSGVEERDSSEGCVNDKTEHDGAYMDDSNYTSDTSDYGTITSIDGRKGTLSFTSDSDEGECLKPVGSPGISPRASHISKLRFVDAKDPRYQNVPVVNEIEIAEDHVASYLTTPGERICSVQDTSSDFPLAAASSNAINAECVNEILEGSVHDRSIEPMETEHNSYAKVTEGYVTKYDNILPNEQAIQTDLTAEIDQSLPCKDNFSSPNAWNDDSNTSTSSSDYKTPQQSPNVSMNEEVAAQIEDVEIPDLSEVESLQPTPQLIEIGLISTNVPVLNVLPVQVLNMKSNEVRTISVNTDSAPSNIQTILPSKVSQTVGRTTTSGHNDILRSEIEKKIEKLHRHVRSLSDSAISSDFTDENPASMSPMGSRVCDHGKRLAESEIEKLPINILQTFQLTERVPANENRKFSSSMNNLDPVNNSKYLRSLSESNIDDFTEDMDLSNSSNDSITFVFIGDNNSKEKQLQHEYEETRKNGSASSQSFQDYRNTGEHENEYSDSHRNGLTIENDGYIEDTNGNEVSDDVFSNHSASEEIAAIIEKHQDPQVSIAHANLTVPQSESPHTCTDISDGLVQTRRHISETDDDSAPLRHKFGIDESVLPIPERSMSADNLPKRIKVPPGDLHRSRSTGMLAVGVSAVDESESVIFPPKGTSYTDEDHTDAPSQQTLSDMDASISDENSDDYDMDSSDDVDDKSSAIVRSIESKSTSLEDFQEEFIIGYKANKDRFHYSQTSTPSSSLDADMDPKSIHDREHIRQVLETVQKFIMPKPTAVDRGTSMESVNQGSETVSIGIQTTTDETNDQDYQHRSLHEQESDHHVLPSLTARYRAQSMDSFGLGRDASSLELTEGQRNWCTLGELMVETTQLLRRINEHLPELDMKSSGYNVDENQTRSILTQWRRMSNQTGISMTDAQTIGVQTDIEPESGKSDKATQDDKPGVAIEMTLVNNDLRMSQLEKSETVMTEMIPSSSEENPNEKFLCTIGVQTDSFCGSDFCVQTDHSSPLSVEPCTINELETDNHKNGTSEQDIAVDTITTETALPLAADVNTQTNTYSVDYAAVQSIPGFTVPNTQEIEDLRKEHAKLMENLQKASNKRNERREAIKARKQTPLEFSQPEIEAKIELGSNNVKPVVSQAAQGMHEDFNSVQELHKLEKRPKFNGPNKNDPESSLETSKSTEEAEKLLSDDDREISMEDVVRSAEISMEDVVRSDDDEVMSEDNVRSDGEDAEHYILSRKKSVDYNDEILESEKSLGSLTQLSSPGELTKEICDQNVLDNLAGSFVPSTGTSSPDEFVQIKIQFDPKTGLVVQNKMIKEEKPSKGKQDVEKIKEQGSTHEHKWALAGDELRSVWERKLEIKQIVDETKEPSDHSKPFNDDKSEDLKTASLEDQQPQSFNGENNKVVSRDEDALSVDNDTISDKSPSSPVREDVIVPDVYSSIKDNPRFPELEKIIPAQESGAKDKNMSEQDPRSLENKEEKPFIRCETSPKLKTQTPRDKQEPVSPELFSKEMTGPFVNEPGLQALDKENPVENDNKGNDGTDGGANPEPIHETVKPSSVTPYETCIPTGDLVDKIEKQPVSKIQNKPGNYSNTAYSNTKDKPVSQRNDEPIYETFKPIYMPNCEQGVFNKDDTDKRTNDKPGIKNPHKPESKPSNIQDSRQPNKSDDKAKDKTNSAPHTKDYSKPFVSKSVAEPYDEFQDVPVSSPKSGAVPVDDSTQIDVVMLETETQTDLPSPVSEEYPDETFVPLEIKEELHKLQQERQHIMDLLGLAGLPNSLTVELLEAKLNYCIGQTDMLLDNIENYIPSDEENDELIGEEQTTKDYIKKYREDLRKSKDDIDECRNQLNKRYPKAIGRNRTPLKKTNYFNNNRQAEIESFRLERMREQQDYQRSRHGMPHKGRGSTPLHGNSPAVTPRGSDQSRSSSPSFSPGYMTPRERKEHLVDLRRQLIKDVVEDEKQHSRSCSPVMFKSPPQRHRNVSERSQGFSPNARLSISDDSKSIGSSPEQSPYWLVYLCFLFNLR